MPAVTPKKQKRSLKARKAKLVKYLSSVKVEDIFADKNKKAEKNLKRVGLIKSH